MSGGERARDLGGYIKRLSKLQPAPRQFFPERDSIDELHGDEMNIAGISAVVNGDYVRVIQCRRGARLLFETAHTIPVPCKLCGKHFERDPPRKLRILGQKNCAHPTAAERLEDLVGADRLAYCPVDMALFEQIGGDIGGVEGASIPVVGSK